MNEIFAAIIARLLEERAGEFMMPDERGDYNETEIFRVCQMGKYINVDLDNRMKFKLIVEKVP